MANVGRVVFMGKDREPNLFYEECKLPEIKEGQILAKIRLATICGSDLHTISGKRTEITPSVLGHEAVAEIVEDKRSDGRLDSGDRITFSILAACGKCHMCKIELSQKCTNVVKYGHLPLSYDTGFNGCYATHIVLGQGTEVVKLPDEVIDQVAAPLNCAVATMVCAVDSLPSKENIKSVLLQGAGMLGLIGCALLKELGIEHVYCSDIDANRLERVPKFGGFPIRPWLQGLDHSIEPDSLDAVIEVCGVPSVMKTGMECIRPGGTYILVGMVHPDSKLDITGEEIIRKCLTLKGVHNYAPKHLKEAVSFLAKTVHKYPYTSLLGPQFPLRDLTRAITAASQQVSHRVAVYP